MKQIPQDPFICLSFINTQLRDQYSSLELLCDDLMAEREEIIKRMAAIGYHYDKVLNRFC